MADQNPTESAATDPQQTAPRGPKRLDPRFFECANEYLETAGKQAGQFGAQRVSLAILFAAARFNAHVFLSAAERELIASNRTGYLDHMGALYRRMLNEHLDDLGRERNLDVGVSELADEYAAAAAAAPAAADTPADNYVAAAGALPPLDDK